MESTEFREEFVMSYKSVDIMLDDEHHITMSGTDDQIQHFITSYNGTAVIVGWEDDNGPNFPRNKNQNLKDIDLMISIEGEDYSFKDIAEFVDMVRKYNPNLSDSDITLNFDQSRSDHEVVTLVVPRKR